MQTRTQTAKHFYQFYRGREDLFRVAIPFLRLGLQNNEACLWVISESVGLLRAVDTFLREMDFVPYLEKGQLSLLPAERWYLDRGRFSERQVMNRFQNFIQEKKRRGFLSFRGVGDVGWLEDKDWFKFQSYEEKIHAQVENLPGTLICAYPIQNCSLTQTKDILDHHDSVFLTKI